MPIDATDASVAIDAVRHQVFWCEGNGVAVLCCPEGAIGGLADYVRDTATIAIATGDVANQLEPITSDAVTVIVGFTELGVDGRLYNSSAVLRRGACVGIYRKLHPAIRRSVYAAGNELPVFRRDDLTFGIVICNDSNYREPAHMMAGKGASVLFIPSNNQLPLGRTIDGLTSDARACDVARATENHVGCPSRCDRPYVDSRVGWCNWHRRSERERRCHRVCLYRRDAHRRSRAVRMDMIGRLPPRLRPGDRVRLVSPASRPDPAQVQRGASILPDWGLRVGSRRTPSIAGAITWQGTMTIGSRT